jgi:AraC-like DNA-binding protein
VCLTDPQLVGGAPAFLKAARATTHGAWKTMSTFLEPWPNQARYVHVARGELRPNGIALGSVDALKGTGASSVRINGGRAAEIPPANVAGVTDERRGFYLDLGLPQEDDRSNRPYAGLWLYRRNDGSVRLIGNRACATATCATAGRGVRTIAISDLRSDLRTLPGDRYSISDPVLTALGEVLIPALEEGLEPRIVCHVLRVMDARLSGRPLRRSPQSKSIRCGLAPWQERRATEFLAANFAINVATKDVADVCKLSPSHFTRAFKATTAYAPHEWLLRYRVRRAQQLLLGPSPIVDISAQCGFADQSHLTRVFKRLVGLAPAQYRRSSTTAGSSAKPPLGG